MDADPLSQSHLQPHGAGRPLSLGAALALVTPLRDGMNLVAKEYVAAQDREDPGVLILSRFAGRADGMPGALLVNPYDSESVANAIARALEMPLAERRERHESGTVFLSRTDNLTWADRFLHSLEQLEFVGGNHELWHRRAV